ncbi:hypothetical protein FDUTEX481_05761 [Tolypothrix sp. PCC 7601]|nr:hypothetical protein FDUTEX481_05761 [Tolypothrix sp. PCC 7601]
MSRCDRTGYLHFFYDVAVVMRSPRKAPSKILNIQRTSPTCHLLYLCCDFWKEIRK